MNPAPTAPNFRTDEQNVLFTSDTHFGHENIIRFCNRPFKSAAEMDAALISKWNQAVGDDDIVFHLGDFGQVNASRLNDLYHALRGHIYFIMGNHDWRTFTPNNTWRFETVTQQMNIKVDGVKIVLNHYPFLCFSGAYRKDEWQLFGHVHSGPLNPTGLDMPRLKMLFPTQYDVGVDNNSFAPVPFARLAKIIAKRCEAHKG